MMMLPTSVPVSMGKTAPSQLRRSVTTWIIPLLIVTVVVLALIAVNSASEALATLAAAFGLAMTLMLVMGFVGLRWRRPNTVSVARHPGRLVLAPTTVLSAGASIAAGLALLSIARLWVEPELWTSLTFQTRGAVLAGPLVGVFMMVEPLWSLRRPAGLTLDERGVRGVRGGPRIDLPWAQILKVKVAEAKRGQALMLVTLAEVFLIPEGAVSGDVYAVATVVKYYLENPEERSQLVDGLDAVRHVDAEVRAGRFARM